MSTPLPTGTSIMSVYPSISSYMIGKTNVIAISYDAGHYALPPTHLRIYQYRFNIQEHTDADSIFLPSIFGLWCHLSKYVVTYVTS